MSSDSPAQRTWEAALGRLQLQVTRPSYDTWLRDSVGLSIDADALVVGVPTTFAAEWLDGRMRGLIETAVASVARTPLGVRFAVRGAEPTATHALAARTEQPTAARRQPSGSPASAADERYTFASFVVGPCNQLAHAASLAVAEAPGRTHNPLFLYGAAGLGKTHLMRAIGERSRAAGRSVRYVTAEQFTNDYLGAIRDRRTPAFRDAYRSVDLLLVDDIQFLCGKDATQEGFVHTFDALYDNGRQIVVAADRPPASLPLLQEPLRSRFQSGLLADLSMPDEATRAALLRHYAAAADTQLPDDVLALLSERAAFSIRVLQAALNRIVALARYTARPLDAALAREALSCFAQAPATELSPTAIIDAVAAHYGLPPAALLAARRDRHASTARQVAMYLLHDVLRLTPDEIGHNLGGRDRTTVLYGIKRITNRIADDTPFAKALSPLRATLSPALPPLSA
ncbi:MAG: chromosomal replication initiator protein DnaA [Chloroflexi bacterium]|nr:chromosomal replication initiator protein DnaA [Chloroflexota bacterium]